MKASVIQCPNCGAPLEVTGSDKGIVCPSCGSSLELTTGESGFPMARLVAMSQDTSFLAMRQAADRLKEQIGPLESERFHIQQTMKNPDEVHDTSYFILVVIFFIIADIFVGISIDNVYFCSTFVLIGIVCTILCARYEGNRYFHAKEEILRTKYQPELDRVEKDIALKKEQLAKIEHDLDSRTMQM